MERGKDIWHASGHPEDPNAAKEIMAVMFVLVEKTPGAFTHALNHRIEHHERQRSKVVLAEINVSSSLGRFEAVQRMHSCQCCHSTRQG
jgi:hypothetical protein